MKTRTSLDLSIGVPAPNVKLVQWLYDEVRSAILDDRLKRGGRLPSTRELARHYNVSRGTVVAAFEQLRSEGYVCGKTGAGTFVSSLLPDDVLYVKLPAAAKVAKKNSNPALSQFARHLTPAPAGTLGTPKAFRVATPGLDVFPISLWAQIASRRLRKATRSLLGDFDAKGYAPLRQAVSDYLGAARGVKCAADQVIIIAGIQQGLDLTARLVLNPGDAVWVEDPCYPGVTAIFEALGAEVVSVAVDNSGLNVQAGMRKSRAAKLAYVTPAHQFPLGVTLTADRRLMLLQWAKQQRALIFEDDYDSEYRYSGRPISALQGLDQSSSVIFAGSFSKLLFPSLRLGYLVVPEALVDKFVAAKFATDRHSALIDQAILSDFITEGHFARHIRRMRELYAERLAVLRESIEQRLAGILDVPRVEAGVHIPVWLNNGLAAENLAYISTAHDLELWPISRFVLKNPRPEGLLLGFAAVDNREIRRGVDCLATVVESCRRKRNYRTTGR